MMFVFGMLAAIMGNCVLFHDVCPAFLFEIPQSYPIPQGGIKQV